MLDQVNTKTIVDAPTISLSAAAADAVKNILAERNLTGYALRVYVAGGGCCGVNFGMALDNNIREVDTTFEMNGVQVVVDEVSIDYLRGASIDFVNDPLRGSGFAVDSPMAKSGGSCACGSNSSEGSSCGCGGGSCGCSN
jgi:iron-sulfur cluster assembly protein